MATEENNRNTYLIKGGRMVNEGSITSAEILVKRGRIEKIAPTIDHAEAQEIDADGKLIIPGIIDDQVHFREPGLTHKADIQSEARAAVAGGVTSFMEMPNTKPPALTQELLEDKYQIAARSSIANYSFFMGVSNENIDEVLKTDPANVCGVKIFMGSSTGNMLVDNETTLRGIFSRSPMLIAAHCEDEGTIRRNTELYREKYGDNVPISCHPEIRNVDACYISSSLAVSLAKEYDSRFHVLHISTAKELDLFDNTIPLEQKRITAEVCVHHLYYSKNDYAVLGSKIKCNPAIKERRHQEALFPALLDNRLDIIATDHAPHTMEEKSGSYFQAPSGVPLVQHSLNIMLDFYHQGKISLERIVEKMCHAPAICFKVRERGFLREGYHADLAIVDVDREWQVSASNLLYKCGWSPLEGHRLKGRVLMTMVSGHIAYIVGPDDSMTLNDNVNGQRLQFLA